MNVLGTLGDVRKDGEFDRIILDVIVGACVVVKGTEVVIVGRTEVVGARW